MTVEEVLQQALTLSNHERRELVKRLVDTLGVTEPNTQLKSGAEIVAMLEAMGPIELVDPEIEDATEWVKAQRSKEMRHRLGDWGSPD